MKTFYRSKHFLLIIILLGIYSVMQAQVPQKMSYQAVIRDSGGELVTNGSIGMQVNILQGSPEGTAVYVERHFPTTNDNGLVSIHIGGGTVESGSMEEINWGAGPYFIHTETDLQGGTNYTLAHTSELISVPYAFYAKTAETATLAEGLIGSVSSNILPPSVTILEATDIGFFTATINGVVNGEGFSTVVIFEWGTTTDYGNTITAIQSPVTGSADIYVHAELSGLLPNTTYHYRIRATNAVDVVYSDDMTFTTDAPAMYSLYLEVNPEGAGSVSGAGEYHEGEQVSIIATPDIGWAFTEWTGDTGFVDDPNSSNTTVTMPAENVTLTANFEESGFNPDNAEILLDRSGAAGLVPSIIANENNKGADFNGRYVYVASRQEDNHIYFWDVENIWADPSSLALTEVVSGGTWLISDVRAVDDYIYVSNMVMEEGQVFKIYRWDGIDDDNPQVVFEYPIPAAEIRLGDAISIIGNPPDNGYIFASNFAWPNQASEFYMWEFNNGKAGDAEIIPINPVVGLRMGQYGRVNAIPGVDDLLMVTGAEMGVAVMDYSGNILAETSEPAVQSRSFDPRVWTYNGFRYLSFTVNREWEAQGAFFEVLNITNGANMVEAIQNITPENIENIRVFQHLFGAGASVWVGATHGFGFGDNGKPRTMSFAIQNGFVVFEYSY